MKLGYFINKVEINSSYKIEKTEIGSYIQV